MSIGSHPPELAILFNICRGKRSFGFMQQLSGRRNNRLGLGPFAGKDIASCVKIFDSATILLGESSDIGIIVSGSSLVKPRN